ncbi:glutamate racemase [Photobacterium sp. 1_MG-2023]|uniref:glutamate racemase n=1 Tax=Photobacterium sp. 1_MG-2023 TaxID=3062646 RepID=UPI0026E36DDD|nr:glutamate racemase [Photobacterium sp. 1_MG-2023]MDO6707496.1 glutamate racemase [Photobacterium sp. 1_MG-2023]
MKTILIFDSGVGGLSVYQEIYRQMPQHQYIYAFDDAAFPYGELEEPVLIERVLHIVTSLSNQHAVDLVVIACNTASTIVLPHLRASLTQPVVGVVPAIKPAAQMSQTKVVGVLATPATVKRQYTQSLIAEFAADCEVHLLGATRLVEMAEMKLRGHRVDLNEMSEIVNPWLSTQIDTVVLGCTHFPLLKQEISQVFPQAKFLIDSGSAIASRVQALLGTELDIEATELEQGGIKNLTYHTSDKSDHQALNDSLRAMQLSNVNCLHYPRS